MIRTFVLLAVLAGALAAPGGFKDVDVNDPYVASLLVRSGVNAAQNAMIVRVQKQVVAGFKYVITFEMNGGQCDVTLWDKLDGSVELLDDLCSARPMVRAIVPGGWMTQDHTSKVYLDMLTEVYFASNSALHPDDLKLVKVESQVASGINYKFTFAVGGSEVTCEVIIQHRAWLKEKKLLSETCQNVAIPMCGPGMWGPEWEREWDRLVGIKLETPICGPGMWDDWENNWDRPLTKRSMPGGFVDQDETDEYFTDMLAEVYFSRNDALQQEDLELIKVQSQVVSGINYKFIFKVAKSEVTCSIVINDAPWRGERSIVSDTCDKVVVPMKRWPASPNSDQVQDSAYEERDFDSEARFAEMLEEVKFNTEKLELRKVEQQVKDFAAGYGGTAFRFTYKIATRGIYCQVIVNWRPWSYGYRIVRDDCKAVRTCPSLFA